MTEAKLPGAYRGRSNADYLDLYARIVLTDETLRQAALGLEVHPDNAQCLNIPASR